MLIINVVARIGVAVRNKLIPLALSATISKLRESMPSVIKVANNTAIGFICKIIAGSLHEKYCMTVIKLA